MTVGPRRAQRGFRVFAGLVVTSMSASACGSPQQQASATHSVIPNPTTVQITSADSFVVDSNTRLVVDDGDAEALAIAERLARLVGGSATASLPVIEASASGSAPPPVIRLTRQGADASSGPEAYTLTVDEGGIVITASRAAGLFYGAQTLRLLLPWSVEHGAARDRGLALPHVRITDSPRYEWRGSMLDVARHFFSVSDVKRYIDLMALYKMNRLHLHLSDDQGWRIQIDAWPRLTEHGGSTEVGGGPGGFFTTEQYSELVRYAADRFVTVIPEIDLPGHTNAALSSYPELNCNGVAPELYTDIGVGFSSLCVDREITYSFIDDVVREIAALTPGPYFHIGGDEVEELDAEQYRRFMERVYAIVQSHGKTVVGWDEIAATELPTGTLVQIWRPFWDALDATEGDSTSRAFAEAQAEIIGGALNAGARVILSPADRVYLDMKYNENTVLGLTWAGGNDVRDAYGMGTSTWLRSLPDDVIAGVEAPLWSETLETLDDIEYMAFPRLVGIAEMGWSAAERRIWSDYRLRLAEHGPRLQALGVNFERSPLVPWRSSHGF